MLLDLKTARKLLGDDAIIGVTVASIEEAMIACEDGADYLGIGTIFDTPTYLSLSLVSFLVMYLVSCICECTRLALLDAVPLSLSNAVSFISSWSPDTTEAKPTQKISSAQQDAVQSCPPWRRSTAPSQLSASVA